MPSKDKEKGLNIEGIVYNACVVWWHTTVKAMSAEKPLPHANWWGDIISLLDRYWVNLETKFSSILGWWFILFKSPLLKIRVILATYKPSGTIPNWNER